MECYKRNANRMVISNTIHILLFFIVTVLFSSCQNSNMAVEYSKKEEGLVYFFSKNNKPITAFIALHKDNAKIVINDDYNSAAFLRYIDLEFIQDNNNLQIWKNKKLLETVSARDFIFVLSNSNYDKIRQDENLCKELENNHKLSNGVLLKYLK